MGLFLDRQQKNNKTVVPVWFMRQAGRYHDHYQNLKQKHSFMELCKNPELACETTMGPMNEFHFDAAILFSDLLFPLEQLGMGLEYNPGPQLDIHLKDETNLSKLAITEPAASFYQFQQKAASLLREKLPANKSLIGFVGAPFTLYTYAVEGSHAGALVAAKKGLHSGLFDKFMDKLYPELLIQMKIQANAGVNAMAIFDTAAGELSLNDYKKIVLPYVKKLTKEFKQDFPQVQIIYYSKMTHLEYLHAIEDQNIDVLGIDWRVNLKQALNELGSQYYIQGNLDPVHLHLPWNQLEKSLDELWQSVQGENLNKWIMGLGHGVLQHTPQKNVKKTVSYIHENFIY